MAVNDECKLKFLELKAKRTHRFIIYKINEKLKQVIVEKLGEPTMGYKDFTATLPENECRYAIYDFDFVTAENCQKSKIFFIAWDTAGQERFRSLIPSYIGDSSVAIIVYDVATRVITDRDTGRSRGFGFVNFDNNELPAQLCPAWMARNCKGGIFV